MVRKHLKGKAMDSQLYRNYSHLYEFQISYV